MSAANRPVVFLASGNAHKAAELQAFAERDGLALEIRSAKALGGMPAVAEDTGTFAGNARKKAHTLRSIAPSGSWVLADDSGVCVDHLDGGPGVESAYFAGPAGDAAANLRKLVEVMRGFRRGGAVRDFIVCFSCWMSRGTSEFSRGNASAPCWTSRGVGQVLAMIRCSCPRGFRRVMPNWVTR